MALEYLEWVEETDPLLNSTDGVSMKLQTAIHGGEKTVGRYIVDGYIFLKGVHHYWLFNGCRFHDCYCYGYIMMKILSIILEFQNV